MLEKQNQPHRPQEASGLDTPSPALAPGASVAASAQNYSTTIQSLI